jgi:hypothetical protein
MAREAVRGDYVVAWDHDAGVDSERPEGDRERSDDVAQAAGFDEVRAL